MLELSSRLWYTASQRKSLLNRVNWTQFPFSLTRAYHNVRSEADLIEQVKNAGNKPVVIDFFLTWYQSCKEIASYIESPKRLYAGKFVLLRVDLDEFKDLAERRFGITSMPAYVFVKNGKVVEIERLTPDNPGPVEVKIQSLLRS